MQRLAVARDEPPSIVLDTNVVLDWLYFGDGRCTALADAVTEGRVRWIASAAMRHEIERVLDRGSLGTRWPHGPASVRDGWERWATTIEPTSTPASSTLRCTDTDDQKFIDLALHQARWLISRDRAVLKLGKRAAALGVTFTTPERWMDPGA